MQAALFTVMGVRLMRYRKPALALAVLWTALCCLSCSEAKGEKAAAAEPPSYDGTPAVITAYSSPEEYLAVMEIAAEDDKAVLYYDRATANIALKNKADGQIWFSAPYNAGSSDSLSPAQKERVSSPVILTYLDEQRKAGELNSFKDCAAYGQLAAEPLDNGVRFTMTIGKLAQSELVPVVITEDSLAFLEENLPEEDYRYVKQSYRKIALKGDDTDAQQLAEYPGLADGPAYVMRSNLAAQVKKKLASVFAQAGYTRERLVGDEIAVYGTEKTAETQAAYFTLPLEYTLEDGDLVTRVPVGEIVYDESRFTLTDLTVLRYFGAAGAEDTGLLLLPDGSGVVSEYKAGQTGSGVPFEANLYGQDAAYQYDPALHTVQSARVPVFGQQKGSGGFIAIAEQGDAQCAVRGIIDESETALRYAHFICHVRLSGKYIHSEYASLDEYMRATPDAYTGDFQVRYRFLTEASYSNMAVAYRAYLMDRGVLQTGTAAGPALTVELLGAVEAEYSGAFTDSRLYPLTTYAQAAETARELQTMGLDNLRIRLTGWANGGLDYTVFNRTKPLGILGGSKGLEAMAQALQEDGIEVYPGADISWVRREGMLDGFSLSRNAAHQLDNTYARVYPYNLGSSLGQYDRPRYAVNSRSMLTFADGMLRDFPAFLGGIALEGMGEVINSDSDAGAGSRTDSMNDYTAIAEKAGQKRRLMFTGGNAYVWAYADEIAGLPSHSSGYRTTSYSVPFLQMVLHGCIPYSGESINMAEDPEQALLKAIENGEGLSYVLVRQNAVYLSLSDYSAYHSADYAFWKDRMAADYAVLAEVLGDTAGQQMIRHEYLTPEVVKVTYSGGRSVYVNYADEDYTTADGVAVGARSAAYT